MQSLVTSLGCGVYKEIINRVIGEFFFFSGLSDITEKIIPFFNQHPLRGSKALDFRDFVKRAELIKKQITTKTKKAHLTTEGLDKMIKIKPELTLEENIANVNLLILRVLLNTMGL